ncbi:hypothetical protein GF378_02290 [Candidatus Pacearchaeota archaeon]|nr:hypothetical protein [Candidatus Pacearchaeota archaeon]
MNNGPKINRYFRDGKDYISTKVNVNVECIDMRVSGRMVRIAQQHSGDVYVESDNAVIDVDEEKGDFIFGYRMSDCKKMLDMMGFTTRGNKVKILAEGTDEKTKGLVLKLASIVTAPTKYDDSIYFIK